MSIVVESVSATATASATTNLTVTKPTGVAVGDLLVVMLATYAADGSGGGEVFNQLSGWTREIALDQGSDLAFTLQWKYADSGDVSASNYTFSTGATADQLLGRMIRCSGEAPLNALQHTNTYSNASANSATLSASTTHTPRVTGSLVVIFAGGTFTTGSTIRTFSGQVVNATALTEAFDDGGSDGSGGASVSAAYGIYSSVSEITSYGATINTSTPGHYGAIAVFTPPVNASGTNTLVTTTTTAFNQTGICDGIAGNTLATATSQAFTQGGKGTAPTQWTNEPATTTTWTNET